MSASVRRLVVSLVVIAGCSHGTAAAAAPARAVGTTADGPRARVNQASPVLMPVADASSLTRGTPTPSGAPAPLGEHRPTVQPTVPKLRTSCRRRGARRHVCRVTQGRRTVQRCQGRGRATKRSRRACIRRARRALRDGPVARRASLSWNGWPDTAMPSVGRLTLDGGTCTGTMVTRTLVLTAAHCLYGNGAFKRAVSFTPGAALDGSAPHGTWGAYAWWVPDQFIAGDYSMDFGLVEIGPASNGVFLGDRIGMWDITPNIRWGSGARAYLVGYPQSGFWSSAAGGFGRGQYACDSRWDVVQKREIGGWSVATRCTMNQGASGGPWFVELNDGRWTVGGVNSRCTAFAGSPADRCDPYAIDMLSSYPDGRFYDFWNSVQRVLHW